MLQAFAVEGNSVGSTGSVDIASSAPPPPPSFARGSDGRDDRLLSGSRKKNTCTHYSPINKVVEPSKQGAQRGKGGQCKYYRLVLCVFVFVRLAVNALSHLLLTAVQHEYLHVFRIAFAHLLYVPVTFFFAGRDVCCSVSEFVAMELVSYQVCYHGGTQQSGPNTMSKKTGIYRFWYT